MQRDCSPFHGRPHPDAGGLDGGDSEDRQATLADVSRSSLLKSLSPATLAAIAAECIQTELAASAAVFTPETGADCLFLVQSGLLHVMEADDALGGRLIREIRPGQLVDRLQELSGGAQPARVQAVEPTRLWNITDERVQRLAEQFADFREALDRLHRRQLICRLHEMFGPMDEDLLDSLERAGDWIHLHRDELLFDQGAATDRVYFVISGRLTSHRLDADGEVDLRVELGRGETVGEVGFFTGRPRSVRVRALRDSLLLGYSSNEFETLIAEYPNLLRYITRNVAAKVARASPLPRCASRIATVAIVAASPRAPTRCFAQRLTEALSTHGSTLRLNADNVDALISEPGIARSEEGSAAGERLLAWLEAREAGHRFLVLEADRGASPWTRRCIRQADRILLVADARDSPEPSESERSLFDDEQSDTNPRELLVLVHSNGETLPTGTRRWLDPRPFVDGHHHVRWDQAQDIQRIARVLAGRSVGLVLGGGGARGLAHIGALRALGEAGIPVDVIGGTSIGATIAGQHAAGRRPDEIIAMSRRVFQEIRPHRGFTIPILSIVSSRRTELAGRVCHGDVEIEDLWLPFFCISSSLTTAGMMIHRRGTLWKAALASSSLPGLGTPVLHQRELLVDGAILNNLPTDVMRRLGCGIVIASRVSPEDPTAFSCDRVPTPWEIIRGYFGSATPDAIRFPSLLEVVFRSSLLHSVHSERLAVQEADLLFEPPVERYGLLDFTRLEEVALTGFEHAVSRIARWRTDAERTSFS